MSEILFLVKGIIYISIFSYGIRKIRKGLGLDIDDSSIFIWWDYE